MSVNRSLALAVWAAVLAASALVLARTVVTADLTAFLPASAEPTQQMLIDQLRDGVIARTVLIAIDGGSEDRIAAASRSMGERLSADPRFRFVANGSWELAAGDQAVLARYRYLLSPAVAPDRFETAGLRRALELDLALLGSSAGALVASQVGTDPTGEMLAVLQQLTPRQSPDTRSGVWFARDGRRALMVAETRAAGYDADGQQEAVTAIRAAFAAVPDRTGLTLTLAGPGVFAAQARAGIEQDAWRLSLIATVLVVALLGWLYRSPVLVLAGALPVATGLAAGIAAVSAAFGVVHGITLGFGATLIGEAVDYPTYLLVQRSPGEPLEAAARRIGATLRLAVLTTVFSSLTMLLSSFRGLAQLGLLSLTGILVAGLVTRHILPVLPFGRAGARRRLGMPAGLDPLRLAHAPAAVRGALALAVLAAAGYLAAQAGTLWDDDLENLSPIPESAKQADAGMRSELHAPDVRYMLVVRAAGQQPVLEACEALEPDLRRLAAGGAIGGFDLVSDSLPSLQRQALRRAALPAPDRLAGALAEASRGLPFRPGAFDRFLADVEATRAGLTLEAAALQPTALGARLRSMLVPRDGGWYGIVPLYDVARAGEVEAFARSRAAAGVAFLDLKRESNRLVAGYRGQSLWLTGLGLLAIALVLAGGLRSARGVTRVLAPVVAAALVALAILHGLGLRLTLFHLVALLLVIGVGVNYALFFNRPAEDASRARLAALSVCVCCATTLSAFGALAVSAMPVLHALGVTVGLGIVLAFLYSAAFASPRRPAAGGSPDGAAAGDAPS